MTDDDHGQAKVRALRQSGTLNRRPGKVHSDLFGNNEFFDREDLMQLKYEMLRAAQRDGRSVTEVTEEFGLSRPAFYHAKRGLEEQGVVGLLPRKRGPKTPHKLTAEVMSFIKRVMGSGEASTPQELCEMLEVEFDTKLHVRTVQRAMQRLGKKGRRE